MVQKVFCLVFIGTFLIRLPITKTSYIQNLSDSYLCIISERWELGLVEIGTV